MYFRDGRWGASTTTLKIATNSESVLARAPMRRWQRFKQLRSLRRSLSKTRKRVLLSLSLNNLMKRSWIKRSTPLRAKRDPFGLRKRMNGGRKTKLNKASNARLKKKFETLEITSCELGYPGCTRTEFLSWAHGRKRRKLEGNELDTLVILSCINCHTRIERLAPEGMLAIVQSVIAEREIAA